jgi:hypothetical protein
MPVSSFATFGIIACQHVRSNVNYRTSQQINSKTGDVIRNFTARSIVILEKA